MPSQHNWKIVERGVKNSFKRTSALSISNGIVSSEIYDKQEDFNFYVVNFPFLDKEIRRSQSYWLNGRLGIKELHV